MDDKVRCQSCGMPLTDDNGGTEQDNSKSKEYCSMCYMYGTFTEPDLQLDQMIERSVNHMTSQLQMPEDRAIQMAQTVIPELKRWQS